MKQDKKRDEDTEVMQSIKILSFLNYDTHYETMRMSLQKKVPFLTQLIRKSNIILLPIDLITHKPKVIITDYKFDDHVNLHYFLNDLTNYNKLTIIVTNNVDEVREDIKKRLGSIPNKFFICSRHNITPILYSLFS